VNIYQSPTPCKLPHSSISLFGIHRRLGKLCIIQRFAICAKKKYTKIFTLLSTKKLLTICIGEEKNIRKWFTILSAKNCEKILMLEQI